MEFPNLEDAGSALPLTDELDTERPLESAPAPRGATNVYPIPGPARKQNVACDACRAKKVRCLRHSIAEVCVQCATRGAECTSEYITGLIEKQKQGKQSRKSNRSTRKRRRSSSLMGEDRPKHGQLADLSPWQNGESSQTMSNDNVDNSLSLLADLAPSHYPPTSTTHSDDTSTHGHSSLLRYLFAPYPVTHRQDHYTDRSSLQLCKEGHSSLWEEQSGKVWAEEPSAAHLALPESEYRSLAEDFVNQFFQCVHPRFPLLDERDVRARFSLPDSSDAALPHGLLAVVLALGSKFSAHSTISGDRAECSARPPGRDGSISRSRIVQLLAIRAREVVEVNKADRVSTLENCQTLFFLELMCWSLSPSPANVGRSDAVWRAACRLALQSEYNSPVSQSRDKHRGQSILVDRMWHALSLCDGLRSIFGRFPVVIDDESVTYDLPLSAISSSEEWMDAAKTGALICRSLARDLYLPRAHNLPLPLSALRRIEKVASEWAKRCLPTLGTLEATVQNWESGLTMTACSIDLHYHTVWLIVHRVVQDNGIEEDEASKREEGQSAETLRTRCADEAEHAALRITALTALLLEERYLQRDPLNLFHPIHEAGRYLARRGREESLVCAAGIKQIAVSFGQLWSAATEVEQLLFQRNPDTTSSAGYPALGDVSTALDVTHKPRAAQLHSVAAEGMDGGDLGGLDFGTGMAADPMADLWAAGLASSGLPHAVGTWLQQAPHL